MAIRYDQVTTLRPPVKGEDGILRADAYLTRSGVFSYVNADGSVTKEYRPKREVFDEDSLNSFAMVPVTNGHPPEMVTARNARKYAVGAVGEQIRKDGDHVAASIVVYDEPTVRQMESGENKLSCGYRCDVVKKAGVTPEGERYDAIQTNIRGNHLAVCVALPRAGDTAHVRMDSSEDIAVMRMDEELNSEDRDKLHDTTFAYPEERKLPLNDEEHVRAAMGGHGFGAVDWTDAPKGAKRKAFNAIVRAAKDHDIDSSGFEKIWQNRLDDGARRPMAKNKSSSQDDKDLLEAAATQLSQAVKRADEAEAALASETRRADEAEGELETLRTRIKHLEDNRMDETEPVRLRGEIKILQQRLASSEKARNDAESPDRVRKLVKARVNIERAVTAILPEYDRIDGLTDRELMCVVVEKLHGVSIPGDKSDDYVRARFDSAVEGYKNGAEALGKLRETLVTPSHKTENRADAVSARQAMIERNQNAWKKPLGQKEA